MIYESVCSGLNHCVCVFTFMCESVKCKRSTFRYSVNIKEGQRRWRGNKEGQPQTGCCSLCRLRLFFCGVWRLRVAAFISSDPPCLVKWTSCGLNFVLKWRGNIRRTRTIQANVVQDRIWIISMDPEFRLKVWRESDRICRISDSSFRVSQSSCRRLSLQLIFLLLVNRSCLPLCYCCFPQVL